MTPGLAPDTAGDTAQPLAGKVAVVTGASRRIGRETALGLARAGADLAVHARVARDEIEAVAAEIRSLGRRALTHLADLTDEAAVDGLRAAVESEFGRTDILVNNAAIRRQCAFLDMSLAQWREIMAITADAAFLTARAFLPMMIAGGGGTIVNLGGLTGHIGAAERAHVCAGKAAVVGLTKALAIEFADRGITVNCVAPGKIGGERSATSGASPISADDIPLGREGEIEEASYMVLCMCMPGARFMTGQTVHVSGGLYLP
jgi:3-oxoacyl-[acyl-carrier protein] reductase